MIRSIGTIQQSLIPNGIHVHGPPPPNTTQINVMYNYCIRFSPQEKAKRSNSVHLPFGIGPRNCIGKRLALLEVKMTLIELLKQFSFVQGPETKVCSVHTQHLNNINQ